MVPNEPGCPLRVGCRLSSGVSPKGHCRQLLVHSFGLHAIIFLRPFAPPALPGFIATMNALTPGHGSFLEVASAASCLPWRPMLRRGLDGLGVVRPLPLVSSRRDSLSWPGIPVSFAAPSVHSASNHPLPSRCDIWCFQPPGLPSNISLKISRILLGTCVLGFAIALQARHGKRPNRVRGG
jgi:hypothetical protein